MSLFYAACAAAIIAAAVHMVLSRNLFRTLLGLALLSTGVNLGVFAAGGFASDQPPIIASDLDALGTSADPLTQALVLTAIVIGFALTLVLAAFVVRVWRATGALDARRVTMLGTRMRTDQPEPPHD